MTMPPENTNSTDSENPAEQKNGMPRVIVIDDNQALRLLFEGLNDLDGYPSFRFTNNPFEGLDWIRAGMADVVITDIDMPQMSGLDVTRTVFKFDPLLPVIALTGMAHDPTVEANCLEAGVRYFLAKPVRHQQLLSAIHAVYRHAAHVRTQRNDLNALRIAQAALKQSEKRFRDVAGCSADWIWETDSEMCYTFLSKGITQVLGYLPEEMAGHSIYENMISRTQDGAIQEHQQKIEDRKQLRDIVVWSIGKDNRAVCTRRNGVPMYDDKGEFCGYRGIDRDITEEIQLEEEARALYREREMFFQASEHAPHAVVITDLDARILYLNKSFEKLYGYTKEEGIGKTPRILNPGIAAYRDLGISEEEYHALFSGVWKAIKDPKVGYWEGEMPNIASDGKVIWVHLIISGIRNAKGEITAYMGMPIDITERHETEMRIRVECYQALAELAEARDNETGEHLKRMSLYVVQFGKLLNLPQKEISDMEIFAPLHDIGKVGISDSILLAPRRLSDEEFVIMKTHTTIGHEILAGRPTMEIAALMVRHHHERWDGRGYPDGLKETEIPLCARILALCDVYDALRSCRPYKKSWTHEKSIEVIREGRGTHFDPELADLMLENQELFCSIFDKYADPEAHETDGTNQ